MTLVPALLPAVARAAPRVRLRIVPLETARGRPLERLADVLTVHATFAVAENEEIFRDRWVFAVGSDHGEVRGRLTMKLLRQLPQVRYAIGSMNSSAQAYLDALGLGRPAEVSVGSFVAALFLLRGTRLVTLTPHRLARQLQEAAGIRIIRPPFRIPDLVESMVWSPVFNRDPGHLWLRKMMREVARTLCVAIC